MIDFIVNGERRTDNELGIFIQKDGVTGKTNMQIYGGETELCFNEKNADLNISIEISSLDDANRLLDNSHDVETSIKRIDHAIGYIFEELENIRKKHGEQYKQYLELCGATFREHNKSEFPVDK